ncbi:MAG: T9SS type A sorting domain-containing protein [Bacteroidota bacterium]
MKKIFLFLSVLWILFFSEKCSAQNYSIYGLWKCNTCSDSSCLMGYDYTTGICDSVMPFRGRMVVPNFDLASDPFNDRLFFRSFSDSMPDGFRILDIPTHDLWDTSLFVFDEMEYDAYHNRIIYMNATSWSSLMVLDLSSFQISTLCAVPEQQSGIWNFDRTFNPFSQEYVYTYDSANFIHYIVVNINSRQVISSSVVNPSDLVKNVVYDYQTNSFYGINDQARRVVLFDPHTGNYQPVASLPADYSGLYNSERSEFDCANHRYIMPYGDAQNKRRCAAINVLTGNTDYYISSFPGFMLGSIFGCCDIIPLVSGDTVTSVYAKAYQWYLNGNLLPGDTLQSIVAGSSGLYKCSITTLDNRNIFTAEVNFSIAQIRDNHNLIFSSILAPNPFHATATLSIIVQNALVDCQLKIYNTLGVLVREEKRLNISPDSHGDYTLQRDGLNDGLYFYELRADNYEHISSGKFIIE